MRSMSLYKSKSFWSFNNYSTNCNAWSFIFSFLNFSPQRELIHRMRTQVKNNQTLAVTSGRKCQEVSAPMLFSQWFTAWHQQHSFWRRHIISFAVWKMDELEVRLWGKIEWMTKRTWDFFINENSVYWSHMSSYIHMSNTYSYIYFYEKHWLVMYILIAFVVKEEMFW